VSFIEESIMRPEASFSGFKLPAIFATIGPHLPQWPHALALATALNAAAKIRILPAESLDRLEGKCFVVEVIDAGSQAAFCYRAGLFRPMMTTPAAPDLSFRANLASFLKLVLRQEDPDTLFFNRELCIVGDTELGLIVKNMLDAIEWPELRLPDLPLFRRQGPG